MRSAFLAVCLACLFASPVGAHDILPIPCPTPAPYYSYRWVPAVYETVWREVWVEARAVRQWVWKEIEPGRWVREWELVSVPGHYERQTCRELVSPGHWELVYWDEPMPVPMPRPRPFPYLEPLPRPAMDRPVATVGVEGYRGSSAGEDLSKFSGLSEWPK